jgi:hypothetical protein
MFMASEAGRKSPRTRPHHFHGMLPDPSMDHVHLASAAVTDRHIAKSCTPNSGEMTHVEEDRLAERRSDARGVFGRGFLCSGRRKLCPGCSGLLQDGWRAEGLRRAPNAGRGGCGRDAGRWRRRCRRRSSGRRRSSRHANESRWPSQPRRPPLKRDSSRSKPSTRIIPVILRCERSEPRRMCGPAGGRRPSRRRFAAPQGAGSRIRTTSSG